MKKLIMVFIFQRNIIFMKCHIYLFRHGQTYYNLAKRFTGCKDSKLAPEGIKSAERLAEKMKNLRIDIGFCSNLSRSRETLKIVLKYHPECKRIIVDERIRERCYGKLEGKFHKTIIKKYGQEQFDIWHRSYDVPPPGGESIKMVEKRVISFIKDLLKLIKKEKVNVAISAHGNSMRPFRRYFENLTVEEMMKLENPYDDYFDYVVEV
jgi:2,3-bisphosphoglycerate-dependent phosphoglycerate mutase